MGLLLTFHNYLEFINYKKFLKCITNSRFETELFNQFIFFIFELFVIIFLHLNACYGFDSLFISQTFRDNKMFLYEKRNPQTNEQTLETAQLLFSQKFLFFHTKKKK